MKFESNLQSYQASDAGRTYLQYGLLKSFIKAQYNSLKQQDQSSDLTGNLNLYTKKHLHGYHDLGFGGAKIPADATRFELLNSLGLLFQLASDYTHLVAYGKINEQGFRRIQGKLSRVSSARHHFGLDSAGFVNRERTSSELIGVQKSIRHVQDAIKDSAFEKKGSRSPITEEFLQRTTSSPSLALETALINGREDEADTLLHGLKPEDVSGEQTNLLHTLTERLCHWQALQDANTHSSTEGLHHTFLGISDEQLHMTQSVFRWFSEHTPHVFLKADAIGRLPLHHLAAYGNVDAVTGCINSMMDHQPGSLHELLLLQDINLATPVHIALLAKHTDVAAAICKSINKSIICVAEVTGSVRSRLNDLKVISIETGNDMVFASLMEIDSSLDYENNNGETLLYLAARSGRAQVTKAILASHHTPSDLLDRPNKARGWSPLFTACACGHLDLVKILVAAGANYSMMDSRGWSAQECAAWRGNLRIAEHLALQPGIETRPRKLTRSLAKPSGTSQGHSEMSPDTSLVMVRLGASNTRQPAQPLELESTFLLDHQATLSLPNIRLLVSLNDDSGSSFNTELALLHNMTNHPLIFSSKTPNQSRLTFILESSEVASASHPRTLGMGIMLLQELTTGLAEKHESLVRDHRVPIVDPKTSRLLGTVTFNLLVATYFKPVLPYRQPSEGFWRSSGGTTVIGHRGFGANKAKQKYLQIGENTLQGFKSASSLGASCVEFDVQLTKDFVPVIYHDFQVRDNGIDSTLCTLSKDQFQHIAKAQDYRHDLPSAAEHRFAAKNHDQREAAPRLRSRSLNAFDDSRSHDLVDRLRLTSYGSTKAVKGNRRGFTIQEPSTTLHEMLTRLPEDVDFDLEMKYPMLWEAEDQKFEPWAIEANFYVDAILQMVYNHAGKRDITFSSFSPEICILLSLKQKDFPVLFITKAGNVPTGDTRTSSLQEAVHFAKAWGLAGIVSLIKPLHLCPRLVGYAKSFGLVIGTYGTQSDDPEAVKILADAGLDGIVTNRVRLISRSLEESSD